MSCSIQYLEVFFSFLFFLNTQFFIFLAAALLLFYYVDIVVMSSTTTRRSMRWISTMLEFAMRLEGPLPKNVLHSGQRPDRDQVKINQNVVKKVVNSTPICQFTRN